MIPIKNIYYMLTYAFKSLRSDGYKYIEKEEFKNTSEMFAEILIKGLNIEIKKGLNKQYIIEKEESSIVRGKINITESIKSFSSLKNKLICEFDEFSVNNQMNQILKLTLRLLLKAETNNFQKREINKLILYLNEVSDLTFHEINWKLRFDRNNQNYKMLISICYLFIKGQLQTTRDGSHKIINFIDDQRMSSLYEKFIFEYYKKEYPQIKVTSSQVKWMLDDDFSDMLPIMQTDIMLEKNNKILIIDAKYYGSITRSYYDSNKFVSGNLYQIFTYVKNKHEEVKNKDIEVSGMLLYALPEKEFMINKDYKMSGNNISVRTLDLDKDFNDISNQLDNVLYNYLLIGEHHGNRATK